MMEILWHVQMPVSSLLSYAAEWKIDVILSFCMPVRMVLGSAWPNKAEYGDHHLSVSTSDTSESYAHAIEGHFIWDW